MKRSLFGIFILFIVCFSTAPMLDAATEPGTVPATEDLLSAPSAEVRTELLGGFYSKTAKIFVSVDAGGE